jgi:hypothetical protein
MLPPVTVQLYVAPGCAATLAPLPVELGQTFARAAMLTLGAAVIDTVWLPFALQEPLLMATASCTCPEASAVKTIAFVPWPPVIVAPVTLQLMAAPAGWAGTLALLPVLLGQTVAGPEMVVSGAGMMVTL